MMRTGSVGRGNEPLHDGCDAVSDHGSAGVKLHGQVSMQTTPQLGAVLDNLATTAPEALTVDLRDVTSISVDMLALISQSARHLDKVTILLPARVTQPLDELFEAIEQQVRADETEFALCI